MRVASIERETPACVVVAFEGFDVVGFPPDHLLPVALASVLKTGRRGMTLMPGPQQAMEPSRSYGRSGTKASPVEFYGEGCRGTGEVSMSIVHRLVPIVALAAFVPAAALAQSPAGPGAGGIIGGPVGAPEPSAAGSKIPPPPPNVVEFVTKAAAPTAVTLPGNLVVGATLPKDVMLTQVPLDVYTEQSPTTFAYANINGHKVIVDNATLKVVDILG